MLPTKFEKPRAGIGEVAPVPDVQVKGADLAFAQKLMSRLDEFEEKLNLLLERHIIKDCYTTEEVARQLNKAEFTIREYCRLGRMKAHKCLSGRGRHTSWAIPHEELLRYQREGLLPEKWHRDRQE